jgi:hypothetical protein
MSGFLDDLSRISPVVQAFQPVLTQAKARNYIITGDFAKGSIALFLREKVRVRAHKRPLGNEYR